MQSRDHQRLNRSLHDLIGSAKTSSSSSSCSQQQPQNDANPSGPAAAVPPLPTSTSVAYPNDRQPSTKSLHSTKSRRQSSIKSLGSTTNKKGVDVYSGASLSASAPDAFVTQPTLDSKTNTPYITIAPGVKARFRGAKETYTSVLVERDVVMSLCYNCNQEIYTLANAQYIFCPHCKVVSPLDSAKRCGRNGGGVGLGFTKQEMETWQREQQAEQQEPQETEQTQPPVA